MATDLTEVYTEFGSERVPPGQHVTDGFPVLSKGNTPSWDPDTWTFSISGAIEDPVTFSWPEFKDLPAETQLQDFHCVTGWSKLDCEFTGVRLSELLERTRVNADAEHVLFSALDGYTTGLSLADCRHPGVLLAYEFDGESLTRDHGGPVRVVTPHKYAYKGAKWVDGVEVLTEPQRGFWERRGYSVTANPWAEERYR